MMHQKLTSGNDTAFLYMFIFIYIKIYVYSQLPPLPFLLLSLSSVCEPFIFFSGRGWPVLYPLRNKTTKCLYLQIFSPSLFEGQQHACDLLFFFEFPAFLNPCTPRPASHTLHPHLTPFYAPPFSLQLRPRAYNNLDPSHNLQLGRAHLPSVTV